MARNGSGVYSLPAGNPVVTGTTISSTWANTTLNDIANNITTSIASDGQTVPTANLPMGTYAHTNVGNASVRTMYASAAQVQDGSLTYLGSVSGTDTITASAAVGMTSYTVGQVFTFVAAGANTGATTININGIGAKSITKNGTTALSAGDIATGQAITIVYDGTQFQVASRVATTYTGLATVNGIVKGNGSSSFSAATAGTDYAVPTTASTWSTSQRGTITDNVASLSFNMATTNNFKTTPTATGALTFTNITAGQSGYVLLVNTGGYAITAAATTKVNSSFLATVSTAGTYLCSYFSDGTNVYVTTGGAMA